MKFLLSMRGLVIWILLLSFTGITGMAAPVMSIVEESPNKITVIDIKDREISIPQPVKSIVILDNHQQMTHALVAFGEYDKIVGVDQETTKEKILFPNIGEKAMVGVSSEPDLEKIIGLKPDLVLAGNVDDALVKKLEDSDLTVVTVSLWPTPTEGFAPTIKNAEVLGTLIGAKNKAKEYSTWLSGHLNKIEDKVKTLPVEERPKALLIYKWDVAKLSSIGKDNRFSYMLNFVGAENLADKTIGNWVEIDPELAIADNPDVIIYDETDYNASGYGITDPTIIASNIEKLKEIPGFSTIDAVKNNQVYGIPKSLLSGNTWLGTIYVAPLINPELFADIDPDAIHQEYLQKFLGINFDVKKDGIFVYPPQ